MRPPNNNLPPAQPIVIASSRTTNHRTLKAGIGIAGIWDVGSLLIRRWSHLLARKGLCHSVRLVVSPKNVTVRFAPVISRRRPLASVLHSRYSSVEVRLQYGLGIGCENSPLAFRLKLSLFPPFIAQYRTRRFRVYS